MSVGQRTSESEESLKAYYASHGSEALHHLSGQPTLKSNRRRRLFATYSSVAAISLLILITLTYRSAHSSAPHVSNIPESSPPAFPTETQSISPEKLEIALDTSPPTNVSAASYVLLNGPPTIRFRDNLKPDIKYITSWISAGWTNDVMTYMNLLYLGLITERVPIIPMFTPSHIGGSVPPIFFGDVFDVPRYRSAVGPILEWRDVKDVKSNTLDDLGCWNIWQSVQYREAKPRGSVVPDLLSLDVSYTQAPSWVKLMPNFEHDPHATFWSLATLTFPETRASNLVAPAKSQYHSVSLPPDEQLSCFDYLYYTCAQTPYEFDFDYSPAWRFVGQHLHWTPELSALRDKYLRKTMGVIDDKPLPPYISIHIRHGDFANWCGEVPVEDCFASMRVIARRVEEVKLELLQRKGISVLHVIMTSDERNSTFWDDVAKEGWLQVNHSETTATYGHWYPVLIDAAIQSGGQGFVGTDRSTMSILARRRAQSWQDAAVRTIKWGKPDADDH